MLLLDPAAADSHERRHHLNERGMSSCPCCHALRLVITALYKKVDIAYPPGRVGPTGIGDRRTGSTRRLSHDPWLQLMLKGSNTTCSVKDLETSGSVSAMSQAEPDHVALIQLVKCTAARPRNHL